MSTVKQPSIATKAQDISPVPTHGIGSAAMDGNGNKGSRDYGNKLKGRSMTGGPKPTAISEGTRKEDNPS